MGTEGLLSPEQEEALRSAAVALLDRFFSDIGHLEPAVTSLTRT